MLGRVSLHTSVVACALIGLLGLALGPSAGARRPPTPQAVALEAIARLAGHGRIDAAQAAADRTAVARAVRLIDLLPRNRAAPVASALDQVSALADRLTAPRALALFGQLTVNDDWFARHGPPSPQSDVTGADGVVYRYFPGAAFEFHPLANFAALNGDATSKNVAATTALAAALVARGVPEPGGGIGWEYDFDYAGGQAPWLSGFAQVVAAQAFARAAELLTGQTAPLMAEANAAYRTVHDGLLQYPSFGPWIRLYGFNHAVVLNAQLQTSISLASYAAASGNSRAAALATAMRNAAAAALPDFDTGYWTYYSLAGDPSSLSYQTYVVQLLKTLSKTDPRFAAAAARFATYQTEPPLFKLASAGVGAVEFWVSKPATVRVSALGSVQRLSVGGGWHVVSWNPGHAGIFPVTLRATDWAGNSGSAEALPIVRVAAGPRPARPRAKAKAKATVEHAALVRAATALPPLVVAAGLDTTGEASLAQTDGFAADRLTLTWPSGAASPSAAVVASLDGLPAGTDLVLELDATTLPVDAPGRAELAAYAAALASQVPALRDLIVGPAATLADASDDEAALAAVYDAVGQVAPGVRVDGDLDGAAAPAQTLAALAAAYRESGRTTPLLGALAFQPAASGAAGWSLADLPTLVSALGADFAGTAQSGASLPLIVDDVAVDSAIPQAKLGLYQPAATGGVSEAAQAAAYSAALSTAGCQSTVVAVILDRLVDGTAAGEQSGLYYADGSPKTSLAAVLRTVAALQSPSRTCTPPAPTTTPTPAPSTTTSPPAATTAPSGPLATPGSLAFPSSISTSGAPRVHVGCTRACLYLVTLQRDYDGAPVLATRGALGAGAVRTVTLPHDPVAAGRYRFAVWLIGQDDPGTVEVERSPVVAAAAA